jgi:hypothetical protein
MLTGAVLGQLAPVSRITSSAAIVVFNNGLIFYRDL